MARPPPCSSRLFPATGPTPPPPSRCLAITSRPETTPQPRNCWRTWWLNRRNKGNWPDLPSSFAVPPPRQPCRGASGAPAGRQASPGDNWRWQCPRPRSSWAPLARPPRSSTQPSRKTPAILMSDVSSPSFASGKAKSTRHWNNWPGYWTPIRRPGLTRGMSFRKSPLAGWPMTSSVSSPSASAWRNLLSAPATTACWDSWPKPGIIWPWRKNI